MRITEKGISSRDDNTALITRSDALSASDPDIDQQNKKLVEMINDLHDAMRKGQPESVMANLFNQLLGYRQNTSVMRNNEWRLAIIPIFSRIKRNMLI